MIRYGQNELSDLITTFEYGYISDDWDEVEAFLHKGDLGWSEDELIICFMPGDGSLIPVDKEFKKRLREIEDIFGEIFEEVYEYLGWFRLVHWTWKGKIVKHFFKKNVKVEQEWTQEKIKQWLEDLYYEVSNAMIKDILTGIDVE